jgi:hypothetical protein
LPLSQCTRATTRQRPAPTFALRGTHSNRKRPLSRTRFVPSATAFWAERRDNRTVRLQNSITGERSPWMTTVCPKLTGFGAAERLGPDCEAAATDAASREDHEQGSGAGRDDDSGAL